MLSCPEEFSERGRSNLLSPSDVDKVKPGGRLFEHAVEANAYILKAESYRTAYAFELTELQRAKLLDDLEVRFAMHIFGKKTPLRPSFTGLKAIAVAMYREA
jgi:hypothetical protein